MADWQKQRNSQESKDITILQTESGLLRETDNGLDEEGITFSPYEEGNNQGNTIYRQKPTFKNEN